MADVIAESSERPPHSHVRMVESKTSRTEKEEHEQQQQQQQQQQQHQQQDQNGTIAYPGPLKLSFILFSLSLAVFLYGLDQTIIATAIPKITDQFHALGDVGWYASAYLLTSSAFQLLWGRLFTVFNTKHAYISAVAIFELGSLICAAAPTSVAFIVGRAIAGIGAAGVYSGSVIVLTHCAPLEKRPAYTGILGAAVGVASIVGPFIGGAFADKVTWRWCFYINLPLGAVTVGVVILFVATPRDPRYKHLSLTQQIAQLDLLGIITLIPAIICLLLALQWGGSTYPWRSARIIVLFILFGLLAIAFVLVQCFTPKTRTIPSSIFKSRSIAFTTWYAACTFSLFVVMVYYLPLYFQGVQMVDAFQSGVRTMPLILGFIVFALISGVLTTVIGYYTPFMIAASIITPVGLGLLTTLTPTSPSSHWIAYQALFGFGVGTGIQQPLLVIQTVLPEVDVPIGTALITLAQSLAGAVFVAVGQTIFQNTLSTNIERVFPGIDISSLLQSSGVTTALTSLPPQARERLPEFLTAFSKSITQTFYLPIALSVLSLIGALGTEWKSVKKEKKEKVDATEDRDGSFVTAVDTSTKDD